MRYATKCSGDSQVKKAPFTYEKSLFGVSHRGGFFRFAAGQTQRLPSIF